MGCSFNNENRGEDYMLTVLKNFKGKDLKYKEIDNWMIHNSNSNIISKDSFDIFIKDVFVETNVEKNSHSKAQIDILNHFYAEHLKYNYYYLELCLISLIGDLKKDKINYFWNIICNIYGKNIISFEEFKKLFLEYLKINLLFNTSCALHSQTPNNEIYDYIKDNLENLFTINNVNSFVETLIKKSEINKRLAPNKNFLIEDFYSFFSTYYNHENFMNIDELRKEFINYLNSI
jgi:hypothetical protein